MRASLSILAALALFTLPLAAGAKRSAPPKPSLPSCEPLPATGARPWGETERLYYDVDVMGALAGKLTLIAYPPGGRPGSEEMTVRAMAASNSFFSKIRQIRGRASSNLEASTLRPRRYQEETQEGDVERSAQVRFERSKKSRQMVLDYKRNGRSSKKRFKHDYDAFDPLSAFYALRSMELTEGKSLCFDAYGIRRHWRVSGQVKAKEVVRVPAGVFDAFRIEGTAYRVDDPRRSREIHVWISADEKRLPLAALGVMDLGPVRAQLTRVDGAIDEELEDAVTSQLPQKAAPRPAGRQRVR